MLFFCAGVVSEEEFTVRKASKDSVTLDTDEDPKKCKVFSLVNGRCLNDDTTFGCKRMLKLPEAGKP